ncbi:MAG: acyltransferase, partial [Ruminococcus sp.]|nr:acyltransferase [Ruminococcus sp.]
MMPIQVCFFVMLAVLAPDFFEKKRGEKTLRTDVLFIAGCVLSLLLSVLRYVKGKPFPTAFGLLILLGLIGIQYRGVGNVKGTAKYLIIFAVIFIPSVILSYKEQAVGYFIAYSAGIVLFTLAERFGVSVKAMNMLGDIGFSFFLAADIPHIILEKFIKTEGSVVGLILFIIIKFAASLALAYLLTRFVEKPMLKKAKGIESKLK